jgi:phosphatidylglycerol---prolipoprotein diacylglyceryl transferase
MYIFAFAVVYFLLRYRIKRGECNIEITYQKSPPKADQPLAEKIKNTSQNSKLLNLISNFLIYCLIGLLIGARIGHVFFYNFSYYWQNPLAVISPFDPVTHEFIGIYGMSYFGGLMGVILSTFLFIRKHKINFWSLSDFVVPAIPAGYFFGRIGNFINNELYGKITEKPWGMYFKVETQNFASLQLRHPSQLYEAFLEGIVLFAILWIIRNKKISKNRLLAVYLVGYAVFRFICEYLREPESETKFIFQYLTPGQIFSLVMIIAGIGIFIFQKRKKLV